MGREEEEGRAHELAAAERAEVNARSSRGQQMSHEDKTQHLADMGFSPQQAEQALLEADGDFDKAILLLTE